MTPINNLKQWFRNGLKPTQEHFWAWMDSFWHKNEKIPQTSIDGLDKSLEAKAETSAVDTKANKDATDLGDENVLKWKEALGVGELPSNIATVDEGEKVGNTHTKEQVVELLGEKLNAPIEEGTTNDYPYVVGVNEENESVKLPAGDLGKNVANSKPTSVAGAGLNMGAIWDIETNGYPLRIKGLPDKSADTTFSRIMVQNANEQNAWTNGSNILKAMPRLLSDVEKTAWKTEMNGGWTTNTMSVVLINPVVLKNKNENQFITVLGTNLNFNPVNFKVEIVTASSTASNVQVVSTIDNSKVQLISTTQLGFWINTVELNLQNADYKLRLSNGVATYLTPITFKVIDPSQVKSLVFTHSQGAILQSGTSDKQIINSAKDVALTSDSNIKPLANTSSKDIVAQFQTDKVLKGNENWFFEIVFSSGIIQDMKSERGVIAFAGLSSSDSNNIINTIDYELIFSWYNGYWGIYDYVDLIGKKNNNKYGNGRLIISKYGNSVFFLMLNNQGDASIVSSVTINTDVDYKFVFSRNNSIQQVSTSFYITNEFKF